jgi:hypothetical protein
MIPPKAREKSTLTNAEKPSENAQGPGILLISNHRSGKPLNLQGISWVSKVLASLVGKN